MGLVCSAPLRGADDAISASVKGWSGRKKQASAAPVSKSAIEAANGMVQVPLRSIMKPKKTGEMMPAKAEPKFIIPLAEPAWCGAMSIATAQIGATISSAKKNASDRHAADINKSCQPPSRVSLLEPG